jgi:hypothetical protein
VAARASRQPSRTPPRPLRARECDDADSTSGFAPFFSRSSAP